MRYSFSGPSQLPREGVSPESLVVFIHGYGAHGESLLSLGETFASTLPKTLFVAPNGPEVCATHPLGRQWFNLGDWDLDRIFKEITAFAPEFHEYVDALLKTYKIPPEKLVFVGFSQGGLMALHMALTRPMVAGAISFSGASLDYPHSSFLSKPPVLLVHGLEDDVLPASFSTTAEAYLKSLGVPVTLSLLPQLGHSIDDRGCAIGEKFLETLLS